MAQGDLIKVSGDAIPTSYEIKTADFTATSGGFYYVDCSVTPIVVDLPLSPILGTKVIIDDYTGSSLTNNITIQANGGGNFTLQGVSDVLVIDAVFAAVTLTYVDGTYGWRYKVS